MRTRTAQMKKDSQMSEKMEQEKANLIILMKELRSL